MVLMESANEVPDLLFTDVILPDKSGPELAIELRQRFPELPVLYASGYSGVNVHLVSTHRQQPNENAPRCEPRRVGIPLLVACAHEESQHVPEHQGHRREELERCRHVTISRELSQYVRGVV